MVFTKMNARMGYETELTGGRKDAPHCGSVIDPRVHPTPWYASQLDMS